MLSPAETLVVDNLKLGLSNKEIAQRVFTCEKTVKFHLTNIYRKLNVKTRNELMGKFLVDDVPIKKVEKMDNTLPNNQGYRAEPTNTQAPVAINHQGYRAVQVVQKSQEDKILFIDEKFKVGETISSLHSMMKEVTKDEITPSTVNAACNCVARLNETINTAIQAARFLNER